ARAAHAPARRWTEALGAIAVAATQTGHGVLAARGEWVTNEKRLLERAGLRDVDDVVRGATDVGEAVDRARALFAERIEEARRDA
ncbi:nucleotidyltransferase domain-containing protein, partial [Streptomyces sp. S6]